MAAMARAHGKEHVEVRSEWTEPMDLERVEQVLDQDPAITHVAAVHNETTTGRLNDLPALGRACRARGKGLLLDAVSSFGGEAIDLAGWGVQALAATANKCLHGVPGIAFALVEESALEELEGNARGVYLDLARYRDQVTSGFSPFTQSVHACFALDEALRELEDQGGWRARRERYCALTARVRSELEALGVESLLPEEECSSMLAAFRLPEGRTYEELHDALREQGFVIYAGQGGLASQIFRVATMGDVRDEDLERLLAAFRSTLAG
jgi:2-aminoethylphosphonate-pyruvate transaminase